MVDPCRREAWRVEARTRRAESRGGVSDRRPRVFEHSRHSVWLLWHLNSVWDLATSIYTKQANDKMTVKDYIFLQNIVHREKYSNINCAEWWIPAKSARSQMWGTGSVIKGSGSQTTGAGSEIRWDLPRFNPWYYRNISNNNSNRNTYHIVT